MNLIDKPSYTQEIPSRFIKELVAGLDRNGDGSIEKSEFNDFLNDIAANDKFTGEELDQVLVEVLELAGDDATADRVSLDSLKGVMLKQISEFK